MELLKGSSKHAGTTIQKLSDTECMNETELSMPIKDVQEWGVLRPKLDGCGVVDQFFPFENHCECCKKLASGLCHVVLHSPPLLQVNVIVITLFLTKLDHRPLFCYIYY